jgi:chromosome segregation ATPase
MFKTFSINSLVLISLSLLVAVSACSNKVPKVQEPGQISAEQVQQKNQESFEVTKAYAVQEKEKAQKEIEVQLQELDRKIDELTNRTKDLSDKAQKTGAKVKSDTDESLNKLKTERDSAAKDLSELKASTSEAWKGTAAKINKAVDKLNNSTQKLTQQAVGSVHKNKSENNKTQKDT